MKSPAPIFILSMCHRLRDAGCTFLLSLGLMERAAEQEIALRRTCTGEAVGIEHDLAAADRLLNEAVSAGHIDHRTALYMRKILRHGDRAARHLARELEVKEA